MGISQIHQYIAKDTLILRGIGINECTDLRSSALYAILLHFCIDIQCNNDTIMPNERLFKDIPTTSLLFIDDIAMAHCSYEPK